MDEIVIKDTLRIIPVQIGDDRSMVQLILNGYLDTYNSPDFQNHIKSLINSGIKTVLFNCGGLNYISSTGIGAFITFFKELKSKKGDMVLFNLQNKVMDVFQILGFTRFFKIASDFDGALKLVEKGGEKASGVSNSKKSGVRGVKKSTKIRRPRQS
jgi:anti-anti-sigma factor